MHTKALYHIGHLFVFKLCIWLFFYPFQFSRYLPFDQTNVYKPKSKLEPRKYFLNMLESKIMHNYNEAKA